MDRERISTHKNLPIAAIVLGNIALAGAALIGCNEAIDGEKTTPNPTLAPTNGPLTEPGTEVINLNTIWRQDQLAVIEYQISEVSSKSTIEHLQTPPFYKGPEPLIYTRYNLPENLLPSINEIVLLDEFDGFTTFYVYQGDILIGAQSYSDQRLVAEARLEYVPDELKQEIAEIYLHEVHYDAFGDPVFTSKSEVSIGRSWKQAEIETTGEKQNEYYFVLPLSVR